MGTRGPNHGQAKRRTRLYRVWASMRERCYKIMCREYQYYGARGITICSEWKDFVTFAADMGPHPGKGWSLERRNNNEGYSKQNCCWANRVAQARNTRLVKLTKSAADEIRSRYIRGVNQYTLGNSRELIEEFGICASTLSYVVRRQRWIDAAKYR